MGSWTFETYSVDKLSKDIDNGIISIPKYQRGVVWSQSQQATLIDSMNKGYPFGSILLYKNSNSKYEIVDGLQRSTTIIKFVKNPAEFYSDYDIDENILGEIINKISAVNQKRVLENELKDLIFAWVKNNHSSMKDIDRMQYSELTDLIIANYPNACNYRVEINLLCKNMFEKFQDICRDIAKLQIPALVYEGDANLLPEIFERINSQGAQLTKQQIYAASWTKEIVTLIGSKWDDIIICNRDRYENMLAADMEISDYDSKEFIRNRSLNIFELVFGFGKMITKRFPHLFGYDDDKIKVNSIGFNLINACLVQKSSNMNNLNVNIKEYVGLETEKIERFLDEILNAISYVDRKMSSILKFKGNSRNIDKISPPHSEMQIVSIIATVFIARHALFKNGNGGVYDLKLIFTNDGSYNSVWHNMKSIFDENLLRIYAMDVINQKWRGSGDSKLANIITDNYYYNRVISWEDFKQVLDAYYTTLNSERNEQKQVTNPKDAERLILSIIYSPIFSTVDQNGDSNFDIEHLAPKNLMKKRISEYGEDLRLPISSIANLCLLPEYDNRTKKDKILYDDSNYINRVDIKRIEEKYTFTSESDFEWLNMDLDQDEFSEAYLKFLNKRFEKMKEKIKNSLFN